jgi:VCBS repeat-containing protein
MANMASSLFGLLLGRGSSRNDLIIGSERGERFDAKGGNDWINAAGGDDTVVGGKGNDFIAGGRGTDTAVFSGSVRSYSWVTLPFTGAPGPLGFAGNLVRITGPDGTDWLKDIEFLRFNDALIRIGTANAAPLAVADSYQVYEDITLTVPSVSGVLFNDSDPNNDSLSAILVSTVAHGTLSLAANGSFTYTPNADYFGADSFTYKANDGTADGNTVTVSIDVSPVNDAPVALADSYSGRVNLKLVVPSKDGVYTEGVLSNDSDAEDDTLIVSLVSNVAHGTLTLEEDGSFLYGPSKNFSGTDSFTYKVNDGTVDGNTVTVLLTINNAPVSVEDSYTVGVDDSLTVLASDGVLSNDSDTPTDTLTAILVSDVQNGTLSLQEDGSFTYTPDENFNGEDSFTYKVNDGIVDGNTVTVLLIVNDAPVAVEDSYQVDEDGTLSVSAGDGVLSNDSDTENDTLTAVLVSGVSNGTLDLQPDGSFTYTPDADFNGEDSFTYYADDGTDGSDTVTVSITVDPVNDAPVAVADSYQVDEDDSLTVATADGVLFNDSDPDNDSLTAILYADVSHGTLSLQDDGSFTYTPDADYYGEDSFTYYLSDGVDDSDTVDVTIDVNPVNDLPVSANDDYEVDEDGVLTVAAVDGVLFNDSDPENDSLTAVLASDVQNGTLHLEEDGSFTYTPYEDFNGEDSFTYYANDGSDDSNIATVTIKVKPVNDAPVAEGDQYGFSSGGVIVGVGTGVLSNDSDIDQDTLKAYLVSSTQYGDLSFNDDGSFEYNPDSGGDPASDSFTYKAFDGTDYSDTVTVYLDPFS